jgi:ATP-dependent Lhr-like helicase
VGDLDCVMQVGAPGRVASFLQRLGRSGRREGIRSNLLFLATSEDSLLLACGLTRLWRQGFVEPLMPPPAPFHILAQQVLALTLQLRGLVRHEWRQWIGRLPGFAALDGTQVEAVIEFMLEQGLLFLDGGILGLGPEGERRFSGKAFLELMSVFSSAPLFRVLCGQTEVGQVDEASFLAKEEGATVLLLGGRGSRVTAIEWGDRVAYVEPVEMPGRSVWPAGGQPLGFRLCRALREVATGADPGVKLSKRGKACLEALRAEYAWLPVEGTALIHEAPRKWRWWTFAGLRANATLAHDLARRGLALLGRNNYSLALAGEGGAALLAAAIRELAAQSEPLRAALPGEEAAAGLKFSFCVPQALARETLRQRWSDPGAVAVVLGEPVVVAGV